MFVSISCVFLWGTFKNLIKMLLLIYFSIRTNLPNIL
jgi:hypothetical protein